MQKPFFSIVVVSLNPGERLKNTLDSMEGVKNEMSHVGQDMTDMAKNLRNNIGLLSLNLISMYLLI